MRSNQARYSLISSTTAAFVLLASLTLFIVFSNPSDTAPVGPLVVFLLIYGFVAMLLFTVFVAIEHYREEKKSVISLLGRSAIIALLPVMLLALFSLNQAGIFDVLLVMTLFLLLNFYMKRR